MLCLFSYYMAVEEVVDMDIDSHDTEEDHWEGVADCIVEVDQRVGVACHM